MAKPYHALRRHRVAVCSRQFVIRDMRLCSDIIGEPF